MPSRAQTSVQGRCLQIWFPVHQPAEDLHRVEEILDELLCLPDKRLVPAWTFNGASPSSAAVQLVKFPVEPSEFRSSLLGWFGARPWSRSRCGGRTEYLPASPVPSE